MSLWSLPVAFIFVYWYNQIDNIVLYFFSSNKVNVFTQLITMGRDSWDSWEICNLKLKNTSLKI